MSTVFDDLATNNAYDRGMWPLERFALARLRYRLFPQAQGRVLELGVGTGANLPLYQAGTQVIATDASSEMLRTARHRGTRATVRWSLADAQSLPFADAVFDYVTASLVFCSVPDPLLALVEVRRVLQPHGRLILLEHVRGPSPLLSWATELLNIPWYAWNRVCHLNRETARTVTAAGFCIQRAQRHTLGVFQCIEAVPC
ncbi:MAG: class I SAM-dependent methyltransferase [Chloroflexi bacterium]|nr:class I SAM-dependent methyltransferase [Chloroflexota bacterium]MBU1749977.1 class I SAM-dependent methyltransferase [Chloroflexota bacterium]MBU1877892.1 class I SAM-dependent methyltransferase [Chloroflexota bacterium]